MMRSSFYPLLVWFALGVDGQFTAPPTAAGTNGTTLTPTSYPTSPSTTSFFFPAPVQANNTALGTPVPTWAWQNISTPSPSLSQAPTISEKASYFDIPQEKWSVQLPDTGPNSISNIETGNTVSVSPDGSSVYVTLSDGRIESLSAFDGSSRWSYKPEPIALGWIVQCKSSVTFSRTNGLGKFAIYAVHDVPGSGIVDEPKSRIIAISHPGNRVLWISDPIPGEIQGTPLVTESYRWPGEYILFTHNQNLTTSPVGSFSMVHSIDGSLLWTEVAGENTYDPVPERLDTLRLPYGPVGVAHSPAYGRYEGGAGNDNDLFVWSTSAGNGLAGDGYTRAFQLPRVFAAEFAQTLKTTFLKENRWNALAGPVLSRNGMNLYFGIREDKMRGWTLVPQADFQDLANMVQNELQTNENEPRKPVPFPPVLSLDESRLFVSVSAPYLYALDSKTGEILWQVWGTEPITGSPVISSEDHYVIVTWGDGTVMAFDQLTGKLVWTVTSTGAVDGGFSLSGSGLVFYYGDLFGNVQALQLGTSINPTPTPTNFPSFVTEAPTPTPSKAPTNVPTGTTEPPTLAPTIAPSESMAPSAGNETALPTASQTQTDTQTPELAVVTPSQTDWNAAASGSSLLTVSGCACFALFLTARLVY